MIPHPALPDLDPPVIPEWLQAVVDVTSDCIESPSPEVRWNANDMGQGWEVVVWLAILADDEDDGSIVVVAPTVDITRLMTLFETTSAAFSIDLREGHTIILSGPLAGDNPSSIELRVIVSEFAWDHISDDYPWMALYAQAVMGLFSDDAPPDPSMVN